MSSINKVLHKNESVLAQAQISRTFYIPLMKLYALGALLLYIGFEYEFGVIGAVLIARTFYVHLHEIQEKKQYQCLLTEERLIILKGHKVREIFPIQLQDIRTIYIKPVTERYKKFLDVGTLEVLTTSGGRFVIQNIKHPYEYHKAIIGDIVSATHYSNKKVLTS